MPDDKPASDETILATLSQITRQHGTPAYAYDQRRIRLQAEKLRTQLPESIELFYSLKANASLGICDILSDCGLGADVASAGELVTAMAAGFPPSRIFVAGPYKSPETVSLLHSLPEAIISIDSPSELGMLTCEDVRNPAVLRLRPDFDSSAVVTAGSDSRFGVPAEWLPDCKNILADGGIDVIGFHVFAGSQVLDAAEVVRHLHSAMELSLRTADTLGIELEFVNLGGGFGTPYAANDEELDLAPIAEELERLVQRAAPARVALELGRYFVAQAGWYLTSVIGHQTHQGRPAVIVDGGTHQRADLCGIGLRCNAIPPVVLGASASPLSEKDVLGCLSLPADVLAQSAQLPSLVTGDVLAFANAGAYGLWSSPAMFHGSPLPTEIAFDGETIDVMRHPQPASSILDAQNHVTQRASVTQTQ